MPGNCRLSADPTPVSYEGPFVLDRSHPLTEGLSLDADYLVGRARRSSHRHAGRHCRKPSAHGRQRRSLRAAQNSDGAGAGAFKPHRQPRLADPRGQPGALVPGATPGPAASNVRLGQTVRITLADDAAAAGNAVVTLPDATEQALPIHGKQLEVHPDHIGLYSVRAGSMQFPFACNALNADESNLTDCASGQWGNWNESEVFQDQRVRLDWAFILVALGCLTVDMVIVSRAGASWVMTLTWPFWLILIIPAIVAFWLRPLPSRGLTLLRAATILLLLLAICGLSVKSSQSQRLRGRRGRSQPVDAQRQSDAAGRGR